MWTSPAARLRLASITCPNALNYLMKAVPLGPELERFPGLKAGSNFKLGYSPERTNPADKDRPITKL